MAATADVACPICGGAMWDNREGKRNPKAPDMKCKDKSCEGVIWPPKNGQPARPGAAPSANKIAASAGPHIPAIDGPTQPQFASPQTITPTPDLGKLNSFFALYDVCLDHAHSAATRKFGNDVTDEAVAAMTATLFIQAVKVA